MDNTSTLAVTLDLRRHQIHGATLAPIPLDSVVDLGDGIHNDGLCHEMTDLALPKCPQIRIQKEEELRMPDAMKHRREDTTSQQLSSLSQRLCDNSRRTTMDRSTLRDINEYEKKSTGE
jgi:hypothetical protein